LALPDTPVGGSLNFTDTLATNYLRRFYRAKLQQPRHGGKFWMVEILAARELPPPQRCAAARDATPRSARSSTWPIPPNCGSTFRAGGAEWRHEQGASRFAVIRLVGHHGL
jgi:hypothetical protein